MDFIFQYHFLQGGIDGIAGSVSILSRERCTVLHSVLQATQAVLVQTFRGGFLHACQRQLPFLINDFFASVQDDLQLVVVLDGEPFRFLKIAFQLLLCNRCRFRSRFPQCVQFQCHSQVHCGCETLRTARWKQPGALHDCVRCVVKFPNHDLALQMAPGPDVVRELQLFEDLLPFRSEVSVLLLEQMGLKAKACPPRS